LRLSSAVYAFLIEDMLVLAARQLRSQPFRFSLQYFVDLGVQAYIIIQYEYKLQ